MNTAEQRAMQMLGTTEEGFKKIQEAHKLFRGLWDDDAFVELWKSIPDDACSALFYAVEVIDKGSNAVEGLHYSLCSNSVTIPAGEMAADVLVRGHYDQIEAADSLGFVLRLVMPEQLEWELYPNGSTTKVVMYKSCPFDVNNFTGWCVMTSLLLYNYPGENLSYQRLVKADLHPTEENTIILRNCFYDGYDVKMRFDASNPAEPKITMDEDQMLSDEASALIAEYGTEQYGEALFYLIEE